MYGYFKNKHFQGRLSKPCQIAFKNSKYSLEIKLLCFLHVTNKTKQNPSLLMNSAIFVYMLLIISFIDCCLLPKKKMFN